MSKEYDYARQLAETLHKKFWPENTNWEPLPDLMGVLTQLDNMTTLMDDQKKEIEMLRTERNRIYAEVLDGKYDPDGFLRGVQKQE